MINYEKLKEAHEILTKMPDYHVDLVLGCDDMVFQLYDNIIDQYESFYTIEELLNKLNQLTQLQPKYKGGEKVWVIGHNDEIQELEVTTVNCPNNVIFFYKLSDGYAYHQKLLYATKIALILDQCDYWQNQKMQYITELDTSITFDLAQRVDMSTAENSTNE